MLQQLDTKDENDAGSIQRKSQLLALPDVRLAQELDNYKKLLAQKDEEISTLRQQMVAKVEPPIHYDLESIRAGKTDLVTG